MARSSKQPTLEGLHAQLLGLGKVVDRLEQRLNALQSGGGSVDDGELVERVQTLRSDLDDVLARIGNLQEVVGNLVETTNELAGVAEGEENEPRPVAWVDVTPEAAPVVLSELLTWIQDVLVHHPTIYRALYPCWYVHPDLVQLLLDVKAGWSLAYRHPTGEGKVWWALDWQERHKQHLSEQVSRMLKGCSRAKHDPEKATPLETSEKDLRAYAQWWADGREPGSEPAPPAKSVTSPPARPPSGPPGQYGAPQQPYGPGPYGGATGWR